MATAAVVPGTAMLAGGAHRVSVDGWIHFVGVGVAAAIAMGAALVLTVFGALQSDGRAVLAGLAFSIMAALLCLHGAATPGILVGSNGVVSFTGGATLPVGCARSSSMRLWIARRSADTSRSFCCVISFGKEARRSKIFERSAEISRSRCSSCSSSSSSSSMSGISGTVTRL